MSISSSLLEQTYRFYGEVLGMESAPVQGQTSLKQAAWVYAGNHHPVIHISRATDGLYFLGQQRDWQDNSGSGRIHHVALDCDDYDAPKPDSGMTGERPTRAGTILASHSTMPVSFIYISENDRPSTAA